MWVFLVLLAAVAVGGAVALVRTVRADGLGHSPPPRTDVEPGSLA
ncbi:hypothetical protein [Cellulomonas sp. FA1]|nr:hypothetical protein [Cellulomonas sp. FA1]